MDFIKTDRPQWMNVNVSDTGRVEEFFDHTGMLGEKKNEGLKISPLNPMGNVWYECVSFPKR